MNKIQYSLTAKQSSAYKLLTNLEDLSVLFGGAKGGGKSFLFCLWVDIWVQWLIKYWELRKNPPKDPIPAGFIGRKQSVDFHKTTLETFKRVVPPDHYRIREKDQEIIFWDLIKVFYGGLDDQKRVKKFNSAEFAFFGVDQAEETERTDVDVLEASLRLIVNGKQPPFKRLYTANPADCWLKNDYIDNKHPGMYYIPALYSDNPYLPDTYGQTLENSFRHNEALLAAYKHGDWFALQSSNTLISSLMLEQLRGVEHYLKETRRIVSCDPSLGGDECVIYMIENCLVKDEIILHERDTMKIAGQMIIMAERWSCPNIACDTTGGLGHAIMDRIREIKPEARLYYVNSSEKSKNEQRYSNVKAEFSWFTMVQIQDKKIPYPEEEMLRTQLLGLRFKVVDSNGKIKMEPKDKTKLRMGRSPDRADAYMIGQYILPMTEPIKKKDAWKDDPGCREIGSGVDSAMSA